MTASSQALQRAHDQGEKDESDDRSDCYQGLQKAFLSEEETEAYNKGVENAQEQKSRT